MTAEVLPLQPADLVVVRTDGIAARIIRFGERLQGKPDLHNHVAMLHHITIEGAAWFLEGRPGGLGWHIETIGDPRGYLSSRFTVSNSAQPKTPEQRAGVVADMVELIGRPYDWEAIEGDAASALHMPELWPQWHGQMPGHVVCSSSVAWAYEKQGLLAPKAGGGRFVEPADWDVLLTAQNWAQPLAPAA